MTPAEADSLAALAVELFPKTTDARFALLRTLILPFPDAKFGRETLVALATTTNDLDLPAVRQALDRETARRGGKAADRESIKAREAAVLASRAQRDRRNDEIDRVVLALDDDELERLKAEAIRTMPEWINGMRSGPAREFLQKRDPRKCFALRVEIYRVLDAPVTA